MFHLIKSGAVRINKTSRLKSNQQEKLNSSVKLEILIDLVMKIGYLITGAKWIVFIGVFAARDDFTLL